MLVEEYYSTLQEQSSDARVKAVVYKKSVFVDTGYYCMRTVKLFTLTTSKKCLFG